MITRIRNWWAQKQVQAEKEREERIVRLLRTPDSIPNKILKIEAMKEAKSIAMNWLDNRRITHCELCPENRSLIKSGFNTYRCPTHREKSNVGN